MHMTRSTKIAEDAQQQLTDSSRRVESLEKEAQGLKPQLREMIKARISAFAKSNNRQRKLKALKERVHLLGDELDSLKRRESTNRDLEVTTRKVADAQSDITIKVAGLHRDFVSLYKSTCRGVDVALVEISRRL